MEGAPIEGEWGSDAAVSPTPSPPGEEAETLKIPPLGSGARLGFLLGVKPSAAGSRGAKGGSQGGLPPMSGTATSRKRGRAPPVRVQEKGKHVQKKGKHTVVDEPSQQSPSPIAGSCSSQAPSDSVNYISDDEDDEVVEVHGRRTTRKLTSDVWLEMKKEFINGEWKGICNYCHKPLSAGSKSGTTHLREHLKTCTQRMVKMNCSGAKTMSQSSLRMTAQADGKVNVENYTFDQETAREELGNMMVLHDYPLSMVDHAGFRRFVHAVQPLFTLHTRNTYRKDIIARYNKEKRIAIGYMTMVQSRVAITTDMWTADNQKKGYMTVTGHFVDESWKLRSILMGFIYVPAPHTGDVIAELLHETLMKWNLDEKLMTVTVDNCTSNEHIFLYVQNRFLVDAHIGEGSFWTCLQDKQEEEDSCLTTI